jgi:hypothetical protein
MAAVRRTQREMARQQNNRQHPAAQPVNHAALDKIKLRGDERGKKKSNKKHSAVNNAKKVPPHSPNQETYHMQKSEVTSSVSPTFQKQPNKKARV